MQMVRLWSARVPVLERVDCGVRWRFSRHRSSRSDGAVPRRRAFPTGADWIVGFDGGARLWVAERRSSSAVQCCRRKCRERDYGCVCGVNISSTAPGLACRSVGGRVRHRRHAFVEGNASARRRDCSDCCAFARSEKCGLPLRRFTGVFHVRVPRSGRVVDKQLFHNEALSDELDLS